MKLNWIALVGILLLAAPASAAPKTVLKTEKDKIDYGIGVSIARNFKQQGIEVNLAMLEKGLKDALSGKKLLLSEDELRKTMSAYQTELRRKQQQQRKLAAMDNKKEGDTFLEQNKKKEGVVTLPSGLEYKILKEGQGPKPTANDSVEVRYRGYFIDGKEFDSSGSESRTFKVSEVIPGWREALPLMPVGSKWQLFVPPNLAYGERGMGQAIMPNSTLIFDIELVGIKPAAAAPEAKAPEGKAPEAKAPETKAPETKK